MMSHLTQTQWIAWSITGAAVIAGVSAVYLEWLRLRRQRARLLKVFDRAPQAMIVFDESARIVAANGEACDLYGYRPDEWGGLSLADLCREKAVEDTSRVLADLTSDPAWESIVWSHRRKNGQPLELEITGSFHGFPDERGRVVVLRDVTDFRREAAAKAATEESLRLSENRYRQLVDGIDVISWELSLPEFRFTFVSEPAERILGYPVENWYQRDFWITHVHPDDAADAISLCTAATARGDDHTFEYRMIAADGRHVWIRDLVTIVTRGGEPHSLRGAMIDITAERLAREELESSKRRYLEIVDAHPDLICRFTTDCELTFVNGAYAAFFGDGTPASLLGRRFVDFLKPLERDVAERRVRELSEYPGPPRTNEQSAIGTRGEVRRFLWHNSVVRTENGKGVEFQGVGRDVTALMNAQDAVVRRDAILRTVAETAGVVLSARRWDEAIPGLLERLSTAASASCMCLVAATG
ncbi:MAG: PAS domain-containing protein, partial [bacterium]|nr:PAS domain-containing protein [bacterium]